MSLTMSLFKDASLSDWYLVPPNLHNKMTTPPKQLAGYLLPLELSPDLGPNDELLFEVSGLFLQK